MKITPIRLRRLNAGIEQEEAIQFQWKAYMQ